MSIKSVPNQNSFACYILKDWNQEITADEIKKKKITLWLARLHHIGPIAESMYAPSYRDGDFSNVFGMPFVLSFISIHSNQDLYKHVYERLYIWLGIDYLPKPPKVSTRQRPENIESELSCYELEWEEILSDKLPFTLWLVEEGKAPSAIPVNDIVFEHSAKSKHMDIAIEWRTESVYERVRRIMHKVVVDPEYSEWKRRKRSDDVLTLYDCIESYTAKRRIGVDGNEGDLQYCVRCRKQQKSTRKVELKTFPNVLVLHLDRGPDNEEYVECPINGLNLSKYRGKNRKRNSLDDDDKQNEDLDDGLRFEPPPIYNLYGAVSRDGDGDGEQWSACIKDTDLLQSQWYRYTDTEIAMVSESQVISAFTKILFYRKT